MTFHSGYFKQVQFFPSATEELLQLILITLHYNCWSSPATVLSKKCEGRGIPSSYVYIFPIYRGCAHTKNGVGREWFSLELPTAQKVTKVQIARRMDCCWDQGQNIKITIGPSASYDPNEPTCLEITDLKRESGLQDYFCSENPPPGKFVKLSKIGWVALCEVKVFATQDMSGE